MNLIIRNITSFILTVIILFTTSGYYIFKHQCNHMNSIQTSVLIEKNCCNDISLGNLFAGHAHSEETCDPAGCCKTTKSFHKLESLFELRSDYKYQEIKFSNDYIKLEIPKSNIESFSKFTLDYAANAPPIIHKQSIYYMHNLKLAPPLFC